MRWRNDSVVHPLALAARGNDAGTLQIGQMARNLRLWRTKDFDEVADADFPLAHQVEESKAGFIAQSLKESRKVKVPFVCHSLIFALTNLLVKNIVALTNMF
jgi:hypothetical protein